MTRMFHSSLTSLAADRVSTCVPISADEYSIFVSIDS